MGLSPGLFETDPRKRLAAAMHDLERRMQSRERLGGYDPPEAAEPTTLVARTRGGSGFMTITDGFGTSATVSHGMVDANGQAVLPNAIIVVQRDVPSGGPVCHLSPTSVNSSTFRVAGIYLTGANTSGGISFYWKAVRNDAIEVETP